MVREVVQSGSVRPLVHTRRGRYRAQGGRHVAGRVGVVGRRPGLLPLLGRMSLPWFPEFTVMRRGLARTYFASPCWAAPCTWPGGGLPIQVIECGVACSCGGSGLARGLATRPSGVVTWAMGGAPSCGACAISASLSKWHAGVRSSLASAVVATSCRAVRRAWRRCRHGPGCTPPAARPRPYSCAAAHRPAEDVPVAHGAVRATHRRSEPGDEADFRTEENHEMSPSSVRMISAARARVESGSWMCDDLESCRVEI